MASWRAKSTPPREAKVVRRKRNSNAAQVLNNSLQTLAMALILVLIAGILHIGSAPYVAFAFAGASVIHLTARPTKWEIGLVMVLGAGFGAVYFLNHGSAIDYYGRSLGLPGGFLGMGSLQILASRWIWAPVKRGRFEPLREAALIPALCVGSMIAVAISASLTPNTYDRLIYAFDLKFGGPPSWVIGKLFHAHGWLFAACGYVYNSLPLGLAVCLAIQGSRRKHGSVDVDLRWAAVALGVAGFLLYQIAPASGPIYLFAKEFPFLVPDLTGAQIHPAWLQLEPRNAMPSLHVGWTMLLFWNMRYSRWMQTVLGIYMIMTMLATLGSGEHYLADLIVAAPLALAIQAACSTMIRGREQWIAMTIGAVITLAWLIAFRTGAALAIPAGAATWTLAALTVAVPVVIAWRLRLRGSSIDGPVHLRTADPIGLTATL